MPLHNYKTLLCSLLLTVAWSSHVNAANPEKNGSHLSQQDDMEPTERSPFLPDKKKYVDCRIPVNYKQKGFKQENYLPAFQDFQQRLRSDITSFSKEIVAKKDLRKDLKPDVLKRLFNSSIDAGEKGVSLMQEIAYISGGQRVIPPMPLMFKKIMETACPVGFGGTFSDEGRQVELWYITLEPENEALEVFKEPRLPKYGSMERDTFSTIIFVRGGDGHLKWYGVSHEMGSILSHWYNIQIF